MPGRSDISDREEALRLARTVSDATYSIPLNPGPAQMLARVLLALAADLEAAEERLTAYETPGWINSVQKVMEERRRAEAAERDLATAREALVLADSALQLCDRASTLDPGLKRQAGARRKRALDALRSLEEK